MKSWPRSKSPGAQRILIAYDADQAGNQATEKLAKQLTAEGLDCFRLNFRKAWTRTSMR